MHQYYAQIYFFATRPNATIKIHVLTRPDVTRLIGVPRPHQTRTVKFV